MTKKRRRAALRQLPVRVMPRAGGDGIALEVDGVVQSISVQPQGTGSGYWELLLPPQCPACALLLGLGGGTVAHLLAQRCPTAAIIGIEHDSQVLAVARTTFSLDTLAQLTIVEADAFAWVAEQVAEQPATDNSATTPMQNRYDLICLDLFQAGRLAHGALATPFLRQLAQLLTPAGTLTVNLMVTARTPDQLRRLERVFLLVRQLRLLGNLVIHAQLPPESLTTSSGDDIQDENEAAR